MKNLITMTDFVFYIDNNREFARNYDRILTYAKLLKQPLALWMFVPCELVGEEFANWQPMEIPREYKTSFSKYEKYKEAKEKCLFVWQEGFDYKAICEMFTDLEDIIHFDFKLTKTAIKQIGL